MGISPCAGEKRWWPGAATVSAGPPSCWTVTGRVIAALAALPFVRSLALSGGTAHRNSRGGDDIDLFVVTAAGRVFTTYTLLFLASRLTRTRGVVCPNYLVDENNLQIVYHHDLFTAHQALSLVPIAGLETFQRFVDANRDWVRDFYPAYEPRAAPTTIGIPGVQRLAERAFSYGGAAVEQLLGTAWRFHLGRRAARAPRRRPGGLGRDPEAAPL